MLSLPGHPVVPGAHDGPNRADPTLVVLQSYNAEHWGLLTSQLGVYLWLGFLWVRVTALSAVLASGQSKEVPRLHKAPGSAQGDG